jgi:hypothetical protein
MTVSYWNELESSLYTQQEIKDEKIKTGIYIFAYGIQEVE